MAEEFPAPGTGLTITLHAVDRECLDVDALTTGAAAAAQEVGDAELRIVVSGDFETYVREHDTVIAGRAPYVQERVRGRAVGRIIEIPDGTVELLIDASMLDIDRAPGDDPARIFIHEALHIAIRRRGESTGRRRARLGYEAGTANGGFAGMAGDAGEEFRVERALRELGYPLDGTFRHELRPMAEDYADLLREPFWEYQRAQDGDSLERLLGAAIGGFEQLVPPLAYVIGDDVAAGVREPSSTSFGPARWMREGYHALYGSLSQLPSARTPKALGELDDALNPVDAALKEWFLLIGFRWSGGPEDGYRLDLPDPARLASELGDRPEES